MPSWDPGQYERFGAERARAFHDLVAQVADLDPASVVDLGCGPGTMTVTLADRWPDATVSGVDSSAEMISAAQRLSRPRLTFELGDVQTWQPEQPVDLIVSNAVLHWVAGHQDLLRRWVDVLRPGGALAFQVPAADHAAVGAAIASVVSQPAWSARLGPVTEHTGPRGTSPVASPGAYLDLLARTGCQVNVWETTYQHLLPGDDPVYEWFAGTGLRPYLDALPEEERPAFRTDMAAALRESYPRQPYGTVLPFHRIFAVARRP